jgi:hypothetical protein
MYTAEGLAEQLKTDNPGKRIAIYGPDKTAVGYWHDGEQRWTPVYGKAQDNGMWLNLPPGELWIDGKPVLDQALWKECV